MPALSADYMEMLKKELRTRYVPIIAPLLPNGRPAQEQENKQISRALSAFALRHTLDLSHQDAASAVIDDFNDNGIDAIYYYEESETLYLVQSKLKVSEQFSQAEAQAFSEGIRLLIRQEFATFNDHFQKRLVEIENALGTCSNISLLVVYCGPGISQHAITTLEQVIADDTLDEERLTLPIGYFTPTQVEEALRSIHAYPKVNTELFLYNYGKALEPRKTYYGSIPVQSLVDLHLQHGKALYEQNIRYYLGSTKSDVNRSIQRTLKEDPESFFYFNNGVTALCEEISPKGGPKHRKKLKLLGFSIINGAQTVAAAAKVMQQPNPPDISKAKVLLTLIKSHTAADFGPKVTKARNHQNPVSAANFASLDPVQERLRQELACFGIYYHYRPESAVAPDETNILLEEAITSLAYLSPDPRYAVWLKSTPANFNDTGSVYYQAIFNDYLNGVKLVNAVYFTRYIHQLLRTADMASGGVERLVYRHGSHVISSVFVKRLRGKIDSAEPIDTTAIGAILSHPFDELRQRAADSYQAVGDGSGPLAFFKSQERTVPFLRDLMKNNYGLVTHPAIAPLETTQFEDEYPFMRLFQFMSQQAPQI